MSDEITGIIESAAADLSAEETPTPDVAPEPSPAVESGAETSAAASPPSSEGTEADASSAGGGQSPAATLPADPDAAELAAIEQELLTKNPAMVRGKMRMLRHQALLERTRRQHEKLLGDAAKRLEAVKQFESPEFRERLRAFELAEHNPDQFLHVLQLIPQYKSRIDALIDAAIKTRGPAGPAATAPSQPVADEAEPQPDTLLDGGGMGYSVERANQLWQWRLNQAKKDYDAKLAQIQEGMAPLQQERQARERIEQSFQRQGQILKDARAQWPLFAQYESKIREKLSEPGNERMQLDQAYRLVVVNAERADRARVAAEERQKIQQEMNGHAAAPKSIRPGLPPADVTKIDGDTEIDSIIRNAARGLST